MFDIKTLALLKHGKVWGAKNIVETALLNKWSGGASYEKTVGPAPIISISDAKAKPAKSLVVGMEPIQDLHGYDSPWPAGGGKNVLPSPTSIEPSGSTTITNNNGVLTIISTGAGQSIINIPSFTFAASGQKIELLNSFTNATVRFYNGDTQIDYFSLNTANRVISASSLSLLQGQTIDNYRIQLNGAMSGTLGIMITPDVDAALSAFCPYENLCPISGRTGVTVTRTGKNLLSDGTVYKNGNQYTVGASSTREYPFFLKAGTYTASNAGTASYMYWQLKGTSINNIIHDANTTVGTFTLSQDGWYRFWFYTVDADASYTNIQLELGSTASAYEPYTGTSYPVTWQTEAGTVYGGTVDIVSGVLTVTYAMVDLGTLRWYYIASRNIFESDLVDAKPFANTEVATALCSLYVTQTYGKVYNNDFDGSISIAINSRVYVYDSAYTDSASFTQAMSGVQFCYELATPQTYQLTPQQIQMLKGANVLWSDGDSLTLTYLSTTPANLLGGMLGGGFGGAQEPIEETSEEPEAEPVSEEQESPPDEQETEETEEP